ncbi:MAG: tetratricopeptide repeat protein, partial [Verrucomicrobiales bacterium]
SIQIPTGESPPDPPGRGLWVVNRIPFPELKYSDEAGSIRSSTDFLGKPVLVNLWATWCAPCLEELGDFAKHAGDLRSSGATVLALNVDDLSVSGSGASEGAAEEVLSRIGYDLPRGLATQDTVAMMEILVEFLTSQRVPLPVPSGFLLDAAGNVAAIYQGAISWEHLAGDLALLDAPPAVQLGRASPRAGRWFADPRQIDRAAYLGDYATRFGAKNFPTEAQRLYGLIGSRDGASSAQDHYNQAKTAARQGMVEEAIRHYRAALQMEPEYGQALTGLGAIFLMRKRIDEAEVMFQKALEIDPNHATALVNLAMIDQSRGERDKALGRLEKVIARNPDYAEAHMNIGSLLASEGRHQKAIQHLSKAAELSPRRPAVRLNLATVYMETQRWNEAEQQFRQVLQQNPNSAYAHFGLGTLQARQELHAPAVASYQKAISLGLKTPRSYTRLGLSLLSLGDEAAGSKALIAALQLDPRYPAARKALEAIESRSE